MTSRILILSHPKLTQVVQQVIEGMELVPEVTIKDIGFGGVFNFLDKHLSSINPNLIVTAGAHLGMLNQSNSRPDVPVIPIPVTKFDLLQATLQAQQYGRKIGIIYYKNELDDIRDVISGFECQSHFFSYHTKEEATSLIQKLKEAEIDAIIGAGLICSLADKHGIPSVFLHSEDSILKILEYVARMETARLEIEKTAIKWSTEFMSGPIFSYENNKTNEFNRLDRAVNPLRSKTSVQPERSSLYLLEEFLFNQPASSFLTNQEVFQRVENPFYDDVLPYITFGLIRSNNLNEDFSSLFSKLEKERVVRVFYASYQKEHRFILLSKAPFENGSLSRKIMHALNGAINGVTGGFSNSTLTDEVFSSEKKARSLLYKTQVAGKLAEIPTTSEAIVQLEEANPYHLLLSFAEQSALPEPKLLKPLFSHRNTEKMLLTLRLLLDHDFSVTTVASHLGTSRQTVYKLIEKMESLLGILSPDKRFTLSLELRMFDIHQAMSKVESIPSVSLSKFPSG